jgi:ribosome-binding factor A
MNQRQERFARLVQEELALLLSEVKDPRVADAGLITITTVRVTPDLGMARVGVVLHGGDPAKEKALLAGLERSAGFLRAQLRNRLESKKTPELRFDIDKGLAASDKVEQILREISGKPTPAK